MKSGRGVAHDPVMSKLSFGLHAPRRASLEGIQGLKKPEEAGKMGNCIPQKQCSTHWLESPDYPQMSVWFQSCNSCYLYQNPAALQALETTGTARHTPASLCKGCFLKPPDLMAPGLLPCSCNTSEVTIPPWVEPLHDQWLAHFTCTVWCTNTWMKDRIWNSQKSYYSI